MKKRKTTHPPNPPLSRADFASDKAYKAYCQTSIQDQKTIQKLTKNVGKGQRELARERFKHNETRNRSKKLLKRRDETIKSLSEALSQTQKELDELRRKLKSFFEDLRQQYYINSRNSNQPPSKDSYYYKASIDKMAEQHGLGDIVNGPPEDEKSSDADKPKDQGEDTTSTPSETSEAEESSAKEPKKEKGAQKKRKAHHPGASQKLSPSTQPPIECRPHVCPHCGCEDFENVHAKRIHQFVDLVEKLVKVLHFIIFEGTCANCGALVSGKVPKEFEAHFGPGFHALLAWLNTEGGVTRRHLEMFSRDFLKVPISQGCIQNIIRRVSAAIEHIYKKIAKGAQEYWYNHMDETSSPTFGPMGKHVHWVWLMCNESFAYFKIEEHRSKEAFFVVIGPWRGVLISDDYSTYVKWENGRQTCLAHLKRAAKRVAECREQRIAACGKWLHKTIVDLCAKKGEKLTPEEIEEIKKDFIARAQEYKGVGGKATTLLERMLAEFDAVIYFLSYPVEPTNNFAEQMIRPYVVTRKNSFGTTSECGERWIERHLSLRMTCKLRGESYAKILQEAVQLYFQGKPTNTSWLDSCVYKPK